MVRLSELDDIEESLLTIDHVLKAEKMLDNLSASGFDIRGEVKEVEKSFPSEHSSEWVNRLSPNQVILIGHFIPLRFNSHRARDRALGHRQLLTEREVISTGEWKFRGCWSARRAAKGGLYIVDPTLAEEIIARGIKGVSQLRGPYDDLRWCW